jgi:DNA mismatch repair protein MutS
MTELINNIEVAKYQRIKQKHPDAIILFRIESNYHLMPEDSVLAQKIIGLSTDCFEITKLDVILPGLVKAGLKVAICDPIK